MHNVMLCEDFFTLCQSSTTRGHSYKLYKVEAVVNLCVVCSLQTVLSMYGMIYRRTQILVV